MKINFLYPTDRKLPRYVVSLLCLYNFNLSFLYLHNLTTLSHNYKPQKSRNKRNHQFKSFAPKSKLDHEILERNNDT